MPARLARIITVAESFGITIDRPNRGSHWKVKKVGYRTYPIPARDGCSRRGLGHHHVLGVPGCTNLIGNLLAHLLTHRDDLEPLRDDRELLLGAVEESLRVDPPVLIQPRTMARDVELRGCTCRRGRA